MQSMKLLDTLQEHAQRNGLNYLVAGGHAVNAYTAGRQTGDVDLVVPDDQRTSWREVILSLRYHMHHEQEGFMQFCPPELGQWPLDIILVNHATWEQMAGRATVNNFGGKAHHPCVHPEHLIAMKCHAAVQPDRDDRLKDIRDILQLASAISLDVKSEPFATIVNRYGNEALLGQIRSFA
jgi:hypothetical protein